MNPTGARPPAPHVQAALAAAQPKAPLPPPGARPPAAHVQAALASGVQMRAPQPPPAPRPPAPPILPASAQPAVSKRPDPRFRPPFAPSALLACAPVIQRSEAEAELKDDSSGSEEEGREIRIGAERIEIYAEEEEQEVKDIIARIEEEYGIRLASAKGLRALRHNFHENQKEYDSRGRKTRQAKLRKIRQDSWTLEELQALEEALKSYAPILGGRRAESARQGTRQEITTVGKLNRDVDLGNALAETFQYHGSIVLYEEGENAKGRVPTYEDMVWTFRHELVHGLLENRIGSFIAAVDYWKDADTPSEQEGAEPPPNAVGQQTAYEDMAESIAIYLDPRRRSRLRSQRPQRYAIVDEIVREELMSLQELRQKQREKQQAMLRKGILPARKIGGRRFAGKKKRSGR